MLKKRTLFTAVFAMILSLIILPHGTVFAQLADGTYEVQYEMKEASSDNTSIADGYFGKPAKVTVKNGTYNVQITLSGAEMIKSLSVAGHGNVNVISDSGDTRVVSFTANDLSQPLTMDMHIVVPDQPAMPGGYDQDHQARAVFNLDSAKKIEESTPTNESTEESPEAEDNPPTGDNSQIMLYALLLVGSAGALVIVRRLRTASN